MKTPPIPPNEALRLEALRSLCLLDTPSEERFDRITRSVAHLFKVPIALVSLVDANRQWFKSRQGLDAPETPREVSFCAHAILGDEVFVVEDTALDRRFADNPLVSGEPGIRFYVGVPLRGPGGAKIGTLCLIDRMPRHFPDKERGALHEIGAWAEREVNQVTLQSALEAATEGDAFFTLSPDLACVAGFDGTFHRVNPGLSAALGCQGDDLLQAPFTDFIHPDDKAAAEASLRRLMETGGLRALDVRMVTKDGLSIWTEWNARAIGGRIYAAGRDVTELKEATAQLAESEARYRRLTELSPDIVARFDPAGRFTFASSALTQVLGLSPEQVIGHTATEFVVEEDIPAMTAFFMEHLAGGSPRPLEFRGRAADGRSVWLEARGSLVRGTDGAPRLVVLYARDISSLKALQTKLERQSTHDELTGIPNRRCLVERLEAAIQSSRRHGHPMSVCLCDLDAFKRINDTHGHATGDEVLRAFAGAAAGEMRSEDLAARLGGDEFCFLFPFSTAAEAAGCLERVRLRFRGIRFAGEGGDAFSASATLGIADLQPNHASSAGILEAADRALYQAKAAGRDRVHILV